MTIETTPPYHQLADRLLDALKETPRQGQFALVSNALQAAYEAGLKEGVSRFGPPCQRHEKVIAWLMPSPEGDPGEPGCFGCYLEGLQFATRRLVKEELSSESLPPED